MFINQEADWQIPSKHLIVRPVRNTRPSTAWSHLSVTENIILVQSVHLPGPNFLVRGEWREAVMSRYTSHNNTERILQFFPLLNGRFVLSSLSTLVGLRQSGNNSRAGFRYSINLPAWKSDHPWESYSLRSDWLWIKSFKRDGVIRNHIKNPIIIYRADWSTIRANLISIFQTQRMFNIKSSLPRFKLNFCVCKSAAWIQTIWFMTCGHIEIIIAIQFRKQALVNQVGLIQPNKLFFFP